MRKSSLVLCAGLCVAVADVGISDPLGPAIERATRPPGPIAAEVVIVGPDGAAGDRSVAAAGTLGRATPVPGGDVAGASDAYGQEAMEPDTPTCPPATPEPSRVMNVPDIVWVTLPGGSFMMGSESGRRNEQPVHRVIVGAFEMSRSEVTVGQYRLCVAAGVCTEPESRWEGCNWGRSDREEHPVNCVDWTQAARFAQWVGGRLPTEAEWEFAARSRGMNRTYPWGDQAPSCERAVMPGNGGNGCGRHGTWPVCSKPKGETEQGLCDMAGNVWEWVADWYKEDTYADSRADNPQGPAWGHYRGARGGAWFPPVDYLRASARYGDRPGGKRFDVGFRVVRDVVWNR